MKRVVKIAILYGYLFQGNMGCNALTYSSIALLEQVAEALNVEFHYILSENNIENSEFIPDDVGTEHIKTVKSFYKSDKVLLKAFLTRKLAKEIYERKLLDTVDICFCATGGDSFSDIYGDRFYDIVRTIEYPIRCGKPVIMLPQTIGPFYSEKARRAAVSVLTKVEAVFCRDPISTEITRKLVSNINLFESVDMALFMKFNKQKSSSEKIRVGINPSGLLWNGGYTKNNQFGLKDSYPDVIKRIVSYFTGFKNIQVELIGHVLAGPYYNYIEDDYRVCKLLQKQYQDCIVAPYFYSPIEAKSYISGLDFLTGSRMHCCIAAYSSGVPVFPLAYSRKFAGLFNDGLRYSHLSDLTNDNVEVVLNKLEHSYLSCSEIARTMPERIASLDEYRSTFVNNLTRIIEKIL